MNFKNNLFSTFLKLTTFLNKKKTVEKNKMCFMLYDNAFGEIQKIEIDNIDEWLNDNSFEKTDELYLSILIKEF